MLMLVCLIVMNNSYGRCSETRLQSPNLGFDRESTFGLSELTSPYLARLKCRSASIFRVLKVKESHGSIISFGRTKKFNQYVKVHTQKSARTIAQKSNGKRTKKSVCKIMVRIRISNYSHASKIRRRRRKCFVDKTNSCTYTNFKSFDVENI